MLHVLQLATDVILFVVSPVVVQPSPSPSAGSGEIRVKTLDEIRAEKRKHRMTASSEEMVVADRKAAPDASPPPAKVPCRVRRSSSQQQQPTAQPEELTHKAKASSSRKPELPVAPANPPKIKSPSKCDVPPVWSSLLERCFSSLPLWSLLLLGASNADYNLHVYLMLLNCLF